MSAIAASDLRIAMLSRPGGRARNEDACGFWRDERCACCVLADGAGGHGAGDVASRLSVDTVLATFEVAPEVSPAAVLRLLQAANAAVMDAQRGGDDAASDMRTTLVVLTIDLETGGACWGHIGDSRLYCFREGYVAYRTRDHSLVQSLVDAGLLSVDDPRGNAQRSVLTGSVGGVEGFSPDVPDGGAKLRGGDALLLCSDGFWEPVDERAMETALQAAESPDAWLEAIGALIEATGAIGSDNYSAVAAWCGQLDFSTRMREPASTR